MIDVPEVPEGHENTKKWSFDKTIGPTGIAAALHLTAFLIFATTFYNTVANNQQHTEERFKLVQEQRDAQNTQMLELQKAINQTLISLASLTERQNSQTDLIKDLRDTVKQHRP